MSLSALSSISSSFLIDDKIYGHVLLGSRMVSSGLEGSSHSKTLCYMISVLEKALYFFETDYLEGQKEILLSLIREFKEALLWDQKIASTSLEEVSCQIAQAIRDLSQGQTLLLPGGWSGDPYGHATLYRIGKNEDTTLSITVVDTGTLQDFATSMLDHGKQYIVPFVTYDHVPQGKFLFGKDGAGLIAILVGLIKEEQSESFNSDLIYKGWLKHLIPYRNDDRYMSSRDYWITPQRSGSCAWSCLKAYIRLFLSVSEYKQLLLYVEVITLAQLTKECASGLLDPVAYEKKFNLLSLGKESVAHYLQSIKIQEIPLSDRLLHQAESVLHEAITFLQTKSLLTYEEKPLCYEQKEEIIRCTFPQGKPIDDRYGNEPILGYNYKACFSVSEFSLDQAYEMLKSLDIYRNVISSHLFFIEEVCYRTNLETTMTYKSESFKMYASLLDNYLEAQNATALLPRQFNTVMILYYMLWKSVWQIENFCNSFEKKDFLYQLKERCVPYRNFFSMVDQNPFFVVCHQRDLDKLNQLRDYYQAWTSQSGSLALFQKASESQSYPSKGEEFTVLEFFRDNLKQSIKDSFRYEEGVAKAYQQIGILGEYRKEIWNSISPSIVELASSHKRLMEYFQNPHKRPTWGGSHRSHFILEGNKISLEPLFFNPVSPDPFQKYSHRYEMIEQKDMNLLLDFFILKPFKERQRSYEDNCSETHLKEINSLEQVVPENFPLTRNRQVICFLNQLSSLCVIHSLQFVNILNLFQQNAYLLHHKELRVLFFIEFFKTCSLGGVQFRDEVVCNQSLIGKVLSFVDYLEQMSLQNGEHNKDMDLYLFSVLTLEQFYRWIPFQQEIQDRLNSQKESLSIYITQMTPHSHQDSVKKLLYRAHLYVAYYYLIKSEKELLTKEEQIELTVAYFGYHQFRRSADDFYYFIDAEVTSSFHEILPNFEWSSHDLEVIFKKILDVTHMRDDQLRSCFSDIRMKDDNILEVIWEKAGTYVPLTNRLRISLSTTQMTYNQRKIEHFVSFSTKNYNDLFGKQLYIAHQEGELKVLDHPDGTFRLYEVLQNLDFQPRNSYKRYIFKERKDFLEFSEAIPYYFLYGHLHFYDPEKSEWVFIKDRNYVHFDKALRWKSGNHYLESPANGGLYQLSRCTHLEAIEEKRWIYEHTYQGQVCLHLPRYGIQFFVNPVNQCLMFDKEPQFFLVESLSEETQMRFFGINNYLLMKDHRGKMLLLLPEGSIESQEGLLALGALKKIKSDVLTRDYHLYHVIKNEEDYVLQPTTQEGSILLAYCHLYERKYQECLAHLDALSPIETLSQKSFEILKQIITYGPSEKHKSPEVIALSLHALSFYVDKYRRQYCQTDEDFTKKNPLARLMESLYPLVNKYNNVVAQLPFFLHLSQTQEDIIMSFFGDFSLSFLRQSEHILFRCDVEKIGYSFWFPHLISFGSTFVTPYFEQFKIIYKQILSGKDLEVLESHLWKRCQMATKNPDGSEEGVIESWIFLIHLKQKGVSLPTIPLKTNSEIDRNGWNVALDKFLKQYKPLYEELKNPRRVSSESLKTSFQQKAFKSSFPYHVSDFKNILLESIVVSDDQTLAQKMGYELALPTNNLSLPCIEIKTTQSFDIREQTCIEAELRLINEDIEHGRRLLEKEKHLEQFVQDYFQQSERLSELKSCLEKNVTTASLDVKRKQNALLDKARVTSKDGMSHAVLDLESRRSLKITVDMLEEAVLSGSFEQLFKHNPQFLDLSFQQEIRHLLLDYERVSIHLFMLKRSLEILTSSLREEISSQEKTHDQMQLVSLLQTSLASVTTQLSSCPNLNISPLEALIFCRRSGLIPRSDQIEDISSLVNPGCILQKIMGGGKNAIIAAFWLFIMSKRGHVAALFTDRSLYRLVSDSLKKSQKTSFGQDVFTVDFEKSQLTEFSLRLILEDLEQARRSHRILVMCPEVLQMLYLQREHLTEIYREEDRVKINLLNQILSFFEEHVVAVGDEIDILLRCDFEVNLPSGNKVRLSPRRIALMKQIFIFLLKDPALKDLVGIQQGRSSLVTPADYDIMVDKIAHLLCDYPDLKLSKSSEEIRSAFISFMTMKPGEKIPPLFKDYVKTLEMSSDLSCQEAAHLIALSRHVVQDLLKSVFKQICGVQFGRRPQDSNGKIVPYLGVEAPSVRELAYHYEAVCKHMMTASLQGVTLEQIMALRDHFDTIAQREASLKKCLIEETDAYSDFELIVGVPLFALQNTSDLKRILKIVNSDFERALAIEAESIFRCVTYHERYHHSTAQSLPSLVLFLCGMTGTPWNSLDYNDLVFQFLKRDLGAEGKILYALLTKNVNIYATTSHNLKSVLDCSLQDGGRFPDAILDYAAFYKDHSTADIAQQYLKHAHEQGCCHKKAVLFFYKKKGEISSDRLALGYFVEEEFSIEFLRHTSIKEIIKFLDNKELKLENCLYLYDQRHVTGSDLPLPPDARIIMNAHTQQETRSLCQTIMRARQFCSQQSLDIIFLKEERDVLFKTKPSNIMEFVCSTIINQARKKASSLLIAFKQKIDDAFSLQYRQHISQGQVSSAIQEVYDLLVKPCIQDIPYQSFFKEIHYLDPVLVCRNYADSRLKLFKEKIKQHEIDLDSDLEVIEKRLQDIVNQVEEKKQYLYQLVEDPDCALGQDIENQVELKQEVVQEQDISQDLVNELNLYQTHNFSEIKVFESWWKDIPLEIVWRDFFASIQDTSQEHPANVLSLRKVFEKSQYQIGRDFGSMFPETLLATEMFFTSRVFRDNQIQTVFSKSQKHAEYILILELEKDVFRFVILASSEAEFLKRLLVDLPQKKCWLVSSNGTPLVNSMDVLDLQRPEIGKGLSLINIFAGRASSLEEIPGGHLYFQMWLQGTLGKAKDRHDYLTLRSFCKPATDDFKRLNTKFTEASVIGLRHHLTPDEIPLIKDSEKIFLFNREELTYITPEQVPHLRTELLNFLEKSDLIQAIPLDKLYYLDIRFYDELSEQQILHFTSDGLFDHLHLLTKKTLEKLSLESFLNPCNKIFFSNLQPSQQKELVFRLDYHHLSSVDRILYPYLPFLLNCSDWSLLDVCYVPYLSVNQCRHLNQNQSQSLTQLQVSQFTTQELIRKCPPQFFRWLPLESIPFLSQEQVEMYSDRLNVYQIQKLSSEQISYLKIPMSLSSLEPSKWCFIPKEKRSYLSHDVLNKKLLSLDQVSLRNFLLDLSPDQIRGLTIPDLIQQLPNDQVPYVNLQLCCHCTPEQIGFLRSLETIDYLKHEQIRYLHKDVVAQLSLEHIVKYEASLTLEQKCHLNPDQIRCLTHYDELLSLSDGDCKKIIMHFSQEQVQRITQKELIKKLTLEQISYLTDEQLHLLEEVSALNSLPQKRLQKLISQIQIQKIDNERVNELSQRQFKELSKEQVPYVSCKRIHELSQESLCYLNNEQVKSVSWLNVRCLQAHQVPHATWFQTLFMSYVQFSHMTQVQKIIFSLRSFVVLTALSMSYWAIEHFYRKRHIYTNFC